MSTFQELNLLPQITNNLGRMKYETPTPIQAQAVPLALAGRDVIASAQTGTGKTAAFGIPLVTFILQNPTAQALVLAPTRELAAQIVVVLKQLTWGMPKTDPVMVIGGVGMEHQRRALRRHPRIIVATPGRLVDHLNSNRSMLAKVQFLVLDEADRMLDLGFAPQLETIRQAISGERQTLLFSATFPSDIAMLAKKWLNGPERVAIGSVTKPAELIDEVMIEVPSERKNEKLLAELETRTGSVLIFARTKRRTDKLASFLKERGVPSSRIHGDRSQAQRQDALDGFRKGKFRVLVATDIAARGIDVPHIEHVINYDLPMVAEDYLHRIGRTARAGRSGSALCLVSPEERGLWRSIRKLRGSAEGLPSDSSERFSGGRTKSAANGNRSRRHPRGQQRDNRPGAPRRSRPSGPRFGESRAAGSGR